MFFFVLIGAASSEEAGVSEDVPDLGADQELLKNSDFVTCLCQSLAPAGSQFNCRYNKTDPGNPPTPSCSDMRNGPCICEGMIGCFRAPLPESGNNYERCRELYVPGAAPEVPAELSPSLPPGSAGTPGSIAMIFETEPNDQIGDANEIKFASPASVGGRIAPAGDVDFYKFYTESHGILTVEFESLPPEMKARISLHGKNLNWIMNADASNAGDLLILKKDVVGSGWNYIAISDIDRKAHGGDYSIKATFDPAPDKHEPNDEIGLGCNHNPNQTVIGYICPQDDVDFFRFKINHSGILKVSFNKVPEDMKPRIGLFGINFNWIVNKDASNAGDPITLEKDIFGPGVYSISISDIDRKAHSTEYSIDFTFEVAPDINEPNNQVGDATAAELGTAIVGYNCPQDDVDIYAFDMDASGILEVKLTSVPDKMRPRIGLFGRNNDWIVNKDASNAGDEITLQKDVAESGMYYVAISDIDKNAHTESYTMMAILNAG